MWAVLALAAASASPSWELLSEPADWKDLGTKKSEIGEVRVRSKPVDGVDCVEGTSVVATETSQLLAVTDDMVSAMAWSSAGLTVSEELTRDDTGFVLFQYYDAPGWTLAADRFWVIRGESSSTEDGGQYRWSRVDPSSDVVTRAHTISSGAIEPPTNYGEWRFTPTDAGTEVRYRACADFGGRLPSAVQRWANTSQVPALITDLVMEANRR